MIKAVPEDFELSQEALMNIEPNLGADAWIATNTSPSQMIEALLTSGPRFQPAPDVELEDMIGS